MATGMTRRDAPVGGSPETTTIKVVGRIGFAVVILLALMGISSAVGRFVSTVQYLADPSSVVASAGPAGEQFDGRYYAHPYLTLVHVVTGFLFMVLGPIQFLPAVRNRWIWFHRLSGRVFMIASLIGAISALVIIVRLPVFGSLSTSVAVLVADALFLACLVQGYRTIRRRDIARHREWMIRAFAIGLGISTFRLMIPLLMLTPIHATFIEAWDTVAWLGFITNALVAEIWINVTRRQPPALSSRAPIRQRAMQAAD